MDILVIIWLLLGFALIVGEVFIPGLVVIFFGFGAVVNAGLIMLFPPLAANIGWQLLSWAALSGGSLLFLRRFMKKSFQGTIFQRNKEEIKSSGKIVNVIEDISPEKPGRIHYQGTSWEARCFDETIPAGSKAEIMKQEGLHFYVTKAFDESDYDDSEVIED